MAQMAKALLGAEERKVEISLYTKEGMILSTLIFIDSGLYLMSGAQWRTAQVSLLVSDRRSAHFV